MNRKLPVYLVIDCSYSMRGPPISSVHSGILKLVCDLRGDPTALETVYLSVITFSSGASVAVPLTDLITFECPALVAGGKTDLGAGLKLLSDRIESEVTKSSSTVKGDWKPVVFILSDGGPSDSWIKQAKTIHARHSSGDINVLAVGYGKSVQVDKLRRISPQVVLSNSQEPEALSRFLSWASMSVQHSCKVAVHESGSRGIPLPSGFFFSTDKESQ